MTQQVKPTSIISNYPSWSKSQEIPRANTENTETKRRRQEDFYVPITKNLTNKDSMRITILEPVLTNNIKDTSTTRIAITLPHKNDHVTNQIQNIQNNS